MAKEKQGKQIIWLKNADTVGLPTDHNSVQCTARHVANVAKHPLPQCIQIYKGK